MAIGDDGPVIAYAQGGNDDVLKFAKCGDPSCSIVDKITDIDMVEGRISQVPATFSVAIDNNGIPAIAYVDINNILKLARCSDKECSQITKNEVAKEATRDQPGSSITSGPASVKLFIQDKPEIWYVDINGLKIAKCKDSACSSSTVSETGLVNLQYYSMVKNKNGNPVIAYKDRSDEKLKVAICSNPVCSDSDIVTIDSFTVINLKTSVAIDNNNNPVIAYHNPSVNFIIDGKSQPELVSNFRIVRCKDPKCSEMVVPVVNTYKCKNPECTDYIIPPYFIVKGNDFMSMVLGTDGNPIMSYDGNPKGLNMVKCKDPICSEKDFVSIDQSPHSVIPNEMLLSKDGTPIIAYSGYRDYLYVAKCRNPDCS
jgi:hypothetical protein